MRVPAALVGFRPADGGCLAAWTDGVLSQRAARSVVSLQAQRGRPGASFKHLRPLKRRECEDSEYLAVKQREQKAASTHTSL